MAKGSNRVRFNNNLPGSYRDLFNSRVQPMFSSPSLPSKLTHKSNQIRGVQIVGDFSCPIRGKSAKTEQDESSAAESDSNFSKEPRGKGKEYELLKLGKPTVHTENIDGVSIAPQMHFPSIEFGMLGDRSENLIPISLGVMDSIKRNLDMFGFSVAARGKSGGLALLWNKEIYVDLVSSHIDARVRLSEESEPWRLIGFYGTPDANNRVNPSEIELDEVKKTVPARVTDEMNQKLIEEYSTDERGGREGHVSIKLDMSKAYGRIEWKYLEGMLSKLGFHYEVVSLIMRCVSSVSYTFLLNGSQFGFLSRGRGIRQGDPLSPYLFILCVEGLSCMLYDRESRGEITGVAMARNATRVSHLLFADDTLIFCKATETELRMIRRILETYGKHRVN
ncbi:putative mitochondrial protein [Sesamum angolense]|uniref:Mitochondrial protein n=1 Tax=Sesamum angolense TaxID=2727404 RepID=A0AAE1X9P9_9LAMI|nr:putative mitochondrial protein [Sesamum angolense]